MNVNPPPPFNRAIKAKVNEDNSEIQTQQQQKLAKSDTHTHQQWISYYLRQLFWPSIAYSGSSIHFSRFVWNDWNHICAQHSFTIFFFHLELHALSVRSVPQWHRANN